jgi:hypothetical protein
MFRRLNFCGPASMKRSYITGYRRKDLKRLKLRRAFGSGSRYVDSLGFLAALTFKIVGSKNADLSARAIALYDRCIVPPSRVFDSLLVGFFGKNVHVVASKN